MTRPSYDKSTKPYEVQRKHYRFFKYGRNLSYPANWVHCKYYETLESAEAALKDFRRSGLDRAYRDYPWNEKDFPHITPTINIYRYRAVKRDEVYKEEPKIPPKRKWWQWL